MNELVRKQKEADMWSAADAQKLWSFLVKTQELLQRLSLGRPCIQEASLVPTLRRLSPCMSLPRASLIMFPFLAS